MAAHHAMGVSIPASCCCLGAGAVGASGSGTGPACFPAYGCVVAVGLALLCCAGRGWLGMWLICVWGCGCPLCSVEGKMLRRACDKMALERLVIKKGVFKEVLDGTRDGASSNTVSEWTAGSCGTRVG